MYSHMKDNEKVGETAKGIKRNVIKENIKYEDLKETLFNANQMYCKIKTF